MNTNKPLLNYDTVYQTIEPEDSTMFDDRGSKMPFKSRAYSFSNLRESQFKTLSLISQLSFFGGLYRRINESSLRVLMTLWTRLVIGVAILTMPYYMHGFGFMGCLIFITIATLLTIVSCNIILEASVKTRKRDFYDVNINLLPKFLGYIFRGTYFVDLMLPLLTFSALSWTLFESVIHYFGWIDDSWIHDGPRGMFNDYSIHVVATRIVYFGILFVILMPFFIKKDYRAMGSLSVLFLFVLLCLLVWLCAEAPFYRKEFASKERLFVSYGIKYMDWTWIPSFFSLLTAFHLQSTVLTFQREIVTVSIRQLRKINKTVIYTKLLLYFLFAFVCYICFGDENTPVLMMIRLPLNNVRSFPETAFKVVIIFFIGLNILCLPSYLPPVRNYLLKINMCKDKEFEFKIVSIFILFVCTMVCIAVPNVLALFSIYGLSVININGLIFPFLMKIQILKNESASRIKIGFYYLLVGSFLGLGITGFVVKAGVLTVGRFA